MGLATCRRSPQPHVRWACVAEGQHMPCCTTESFCLAGCYGGSVAGLGDSMMVNMILHLCAPAWPPGFPPATAGQLWQTCIIVHMRSYQMAALPSHQVLATGGVLCACWCPVPHWMRYHTSNMIAAMVAPIVRSGGKPLWAVGKHYFMVATVRSYQELYVVVVHGSCWAFSECFGI